MTKVVKHRTRIPRHAAGENPDKRAAILEGAAKVFLQSGFDAASVNDICRAAGVSKSTLYVYFSDKEDLFAHLVEGERERLFEGLQQTLRGPGSLTARLTDFAVALAEIVCSEPVVQAQRIVISMAERRPDLGASFYDGGAQRGHAVLLETLEREIAEGRLSIPDPSLAAYQLVELSSAGLWRRRLFGKTPTPPTAEVIRATAESAVAVFMASYGRGVKSAMKPET
ncbi:TetR/AcrR family transcriptional regulator [Roseobacter sp. GAI101]|uniref:TetR/AcrR family transcriptional regulator n=1 Tax=Roseobacter sp. (strain GAI101) TaxID=391589 RepID=UPI0001871694|nr:TetR/AcrR family transcriptional regulator [Roseobacter sp. GAI101]EEB82759.1 transcriptional regulator [Roseobacter sp. GAI101]